MAVVPRKASGGRLRSSSGGSPVSPASPSSLRGSSGLGAVGRGGGFFFSSLWDDEVRRGASPLSAQTGSGLQLPHGPGASPTCPGAADGQPLGPGRLTVPVPGELPPCSLGLHRSPCPLGTSSSGPHRLHRRPPGSVVWSSTWRAEEPAGGEQLEPSSGQDWGESTGPGTDFWSSSLSTRRTAAYCTLASVSARRTLSWAARFCSRYTLSWSYFFSCSSNSF